MNTQLIIYGRSTSMFFRLRTLYFSMLYSRGKEKKGLVTKLVDEWGKGAKVIN